MIWDNAKQIAQTLLPNKIPSRVAGFSGTQGIVLASCQDNDTVAILHTQEDLERMIACCEIALFQLKTINGQK